MSSIEKFTFTLAHPEFYEPPDRFATDELQYRSRLQELLPGDWRIVRDSIWLHCIPPTHVIPLQGWKIHLSAVTHNIENLFRTAVPLLVRERTSFKIAAAPAVLSLLTSKQWPRGGAGKCMTVYPHDTDHFIALIAELDRVTRGHEGPYILSDRRYGRSRCVFYRYGGIAPRTTLTPKGDRAPFILSPHGERVPDHRQAWFSLPPWVTDPFAGEPTSTTPRRTALKDGRYVPEAALRHTNSGGLYLATDRESGKKVVIKEARPFTNVDAARMESRDLLAKEHRLLTKLQDHRIGPRPIDFFREWEHDFLVEEYLDGITLRQHSILNNVARYSRPPRSHFREFYREFRSVFAQLAQMLETFGRHGIVFRDLSPTNVIVLKRGEVRLVDFEAACELGVDPMSHLFTPGFASSDHFTSSQPQFENDYFSLGALMLAYLMPMHAALGLDPLMHHRFIRSIGGDYGFPAGLMDLLDRLTSREPAERPVPSAVRVRLADPGSVRRVRAGKRRVERSDGKAQDIVAKMLLYTLGQASYERADRLFPCDPKVFVTNPLSLAYGACGAAYAMHKIAGEVPAPVIDWILRQEVTAESYPPGLYVGMAGIAWVLLELGYAERAREVLAASADHPVAQTYDLFYGLAGWGLTQLKFYQVFGEAQYLEAAVAAGRTLLATRRDAAAGAYWSDAEEILFGYAHGAAGVSLFLLYLYLASGEEEFLAVGRSALDFDLAQAVDLGEGLLWPSRTGPQRTVVPYWRYGSVGIGTVLLRYARLTETERYRQLLGAIQVAASRKYAIFPNRLFGLAGLGDFLVDMADHDIDAERCLEAARGVAAGILLFRLDKGSAGVAFPGADLWKISCDYATGSAGIALFLDRLSSRRATDFLVDELFRGPARAAEEPRWHE